MTQLVKPKRGRPAKGSEDAAAVAFLESEVVRLSRAGHSFYAIDGMLGIRNADRIFHRAVEKGRRTTRETAYLVESERLDLLQTQAMAALAADGLDSLAERVAAILLESEESMEWESVPERVRAVIERSYADTYRAIPVALGVHDRRAKLEGLTHADRIADASLAVDQARVTIMASMLAESLEDAGLTPEQTAVAARGFAERMKALDSGHSGD